MMHTVLLVLSLFSHIRKGIFSLISHCFAHSWHLQKGNILNFMTERHAQGRLGRHC